MVCAVSFSPDGSKLASETLNHTVKLWDVTSGECLHTLKGRYDLTDGVSFSPDGTKVAASNGVGVHGGVDMWHVANGSVLQTLQGDSQTL